MRIFLDTSFIIAAAGSRTGLPRYILDFGHHSQWDFVTSLYCEEEVARNIHKVGGEGFWLSAIRPILRIYATEVVMDYPLVFESSKDRPVIVSALGSAADYLLTLDAADFAALLNTEVYGMRVRLPLAFAREVGIPAPGAPRESRAQP